MTHEQLILAELKARKAGDFLTVDKLRAMRRSGAMGIIVNSENAKRGISPACLPSERPHV